MAEKHTVETVGAASLAALVREFHAEHGAVDTVPAGWVSAVKYAEITGQLIHKTRMFLDRQEQCRGIPTKSFRVIAREGKVRTVKHYFIAAKTK